MIRHEPNRKHGADTYKGPICLEVNDNGTVQLRVPTTVESSRPGISKYITDLRLRVVAQPSMRHE
jgi:hypothetical protein